MSNRCFMAFAGLLLLCGNIGFIVGTELECEEGERACADGSRCYAVFEHCDLFEECADGSDELNCERTCDNGEFRCVADDTCIPDRLKCDKSSDCSDGADEEDCERNCEFSSEFMCESDFMCINGLLRCDGVAQCHDGSDERDCDYSSTLKPLPPRPEPSTTKTSSSSDLGLPQAEMPVECDNTIQLDCFGNGSHCISLDSVCDGQNDCPNGADETSAECLSEELEETDTSDNGTHPQLWVANGNEITKFNVISGTKQVINIGTGHVYRIDYSHTHNKIFWIDSHGHIINRMQLDGTGKEPLVNTFVDTPVALAYDWVHNAIYWADSGLKQGKAKIEVVSLNSRQRRALFTAPDVDSPRVLVVDPRPDQGYLYWGQTGTNPGIYRADLDGSNRTTIVQASVYLEHPSGLTIDFAGNRLLWLDSKIFCIMSRDLKTGAQRVVSSFGESRTGLNGLAVFENWIYWAEGHDMSVYKLHKSLQYSEDEVEPEKILHHLTSPNDIIVYHSRRQPAGESFCGAQNGGCSHLCLASPSSVARRSCVCPNVGELHELTLSADGKTCVRPTRSSETSTGGSRPGGVSSGPASSGSTLSPVLLTLAPGATAGQHNAIVGIIIGVSAILVSAVVGSLAD